MDTIDTLSDAAPATSELEDLARGAFEALARRDLDRPEEMWAENAVDHFLPVGDAVGRGAIVAFFREMFAALPDFAIEVERVVANDPMVVVQWHATGTFTGAPFQGIRATGRRISFRGCDVVEVRDRLVVDNTIYWDGAAFARDVGLLPAKGSLADRLLLGAFNALTWIRTLGGNRLARQSVGRRRT
jgi:steroid delta-isomerase-like uncharacterized protein